MSTSGPLSVFVVPHTHWDREWYKTAESFRVHLVPLIDELLDADDATPFHLDGQAVALDDYLTVRPERQAELSSALRTGRLAAGPWYVLADNLIPSGEALIRNLLQGRWVLRSLRAASPQVLYCPDSFGHPQAGPLLAAGFGLTTALVWRGYGGRRWPPGDTARWRGPAGSHVLLVHLPPSGYETGANLPSADIAAGARWRELSAALGSRSPTGVLLVLNGADHHARQRASAAAYGALARAASLDGAPLRVVGLGEALDEIVLRTAARALPEVTGELRASPDYVWSLQGTLGARASQKRANAQLLRVLADGVEPLAALAAWRVGADVRAQLRVMWREALRNLPHDTLCGCSIDEVARAFDARTAATRAVADEMCTQLVRAILGHDGDVARTHVHEWSTALVLQNPVARTRGGVVELDLDVPIGPVPVGPGSGAPLPDRQAPLVTLGMPMQLLGAARAFVREEAPRHYPRNLLVERRRVALWIDGQPPFGVRAYPVVPGKGTRTRPPTDARADAMSIANDLLRLSVEQGAVRLETIAGGEYSDLLAFETVGERGDLYTHSAIPGTLAGGRLVKYRVTQKGPLRAELETRYRVDLSARVLRRATGEEVSHPADHTEVVVRWQLDAGAPWVRLLVSGDNSARDYRLRLVVASGVRATRHYADAACGAVWRESAVPAARAGDVEVIPPTHPLHRFVSVFDDRQGVTLVSDGLAEYEVTPEGRMAVTLLRATGELSRNDLPERPGHAGWPAATPLAQSQGPFDAMLAVMPHGTCTDGALDAIHACAEDVLLPIVGRSWLSCLRVPAPVSGPMLTGRGLHHVSMKPADDDPNRLVVRCVNVSTERTRGSWSIPGLRRAWLSRLDETPLGALPVCDNRVEFYAEPHAVVTLLLERDRP